MFGENIPSVLQWKVTGWIPRPDEESWEFVLLFSFPSTHSSPSSSSSFIARPAPLPLDPFLPPQLFWKVGGAEGFRGKGQINFSAQRCSHTNQGV